MRLPTLSINAFRTVEYLLRAVAAIAAPGEQGAIRRRSAAAYEDHHEAEERGEDEEDNHFGISSFVYQCERPLSRFKLVMELEKWQRAREALGQSLELGGIVHGGGTVLLLIRLLLLGEI
eukprot:TRINITY_DN23932_c0_g3_i1.p1 TRINITY_DN23932_c0_g3~~TRINITY_DN23932_c0_g3_i1.p1  ORF type:complete len:120 (+),score=17.07 TRINITY_DN23932_c0_g3_i1:99-458(+)